MVKNCFIFMELCLFCCVVIPIACAQNNPFSVGVNGDTDGDQSKNSSASKVVEPENPVTVRHRENPLPPRPELDPARSDDPEYVAEMWWEYYGYKSKERAVEFLKRDKESARRIGLKSWVPPEPGNPDHVDDYFVMPDREVLFGCTYAAGYSYPSICHDSKGRRIFDADVDNQEVLDKIVKQQGIKGKYNKMPGGKPKAKDPRISETFYEDD